jgi:hypothetical protein
MRRGLTARLRVVMTNQKALKIDTFISEVVYRINF